MSDETATTPAIKPQWFLGIFGAFLIFVVIAAYSSRRADDAPDYDRLRGVERMAILNKLHADDTATLTTAAWVNQAKGVVRIPIDEAIPQEIEALKSKPVRMGAALPAAAPAATPPPAGKNPGAAKGAPTPPAPAAPNK